MEGQKRMDFKGAIRPVLAVFSFAALIYFYTLQVVGYNIPSEINSFWAPVLYYFVDRTLMHKRNDNR